jgi:integrase
MAAKKWRGKWYADFEMNGTRIRKVSPVQTKGGANAYEAELRSSLTSTPSSESGAPAAVKAAPVAVPAEEAPNFAKFAVDWLSTYAVVNNKPSEVVNKEVVLRVHLIPFFGNRRLDEISSRDIEKYKAEKLKQTPKDRSKDKSKEKPKAKPLSAKTINNHLTVLRKLLVTAEEWELIRGLPKIKKLRAATPKFDWLSAEEGALFLQKVEAHYSQWYVLFLLALRTGLRRGEIFALHWEDIDLKRAFLTVRYTVFRGRLVTPKNGKERVVPLTPRLVEALKARLADMGKGAILVFPGADGEITTHQDHVDRPLKGALKKAELRELRFHDLRHAFASQLVTAGRNIKEVQELLGHQSIQMTMRYAHLAPGKMREAVLVLDDPPPATV